MNVPCASYALITLALKALRGKFFSVKFIKADGTIRRMTCRMGVTVYLSRNETPAEAAERKARDEHNGIIRVWEPGKGYRSFRVDSIIELKLQGRSYEFEPVIPEAVVEFDDVAHTATIRCGESAWKASVLKKGGVKIPAAAMRLLGEEKVAAIEARLLA